MPASVCEVVVDVVAIVAAPGKLIFFSRYVVLFLILSQLLAA